MIQYLKPLHLVCINDDFRPNCRLIEIKNGIAQATNGHMLIKIQLADNSELTPEDIATLNGKYIDMEVWKEAFKCEKLEITEEVIIVHKNGIRKMFDYSDSQGTFFNLDSVIETIKSKHSEGKEFIRLNARSISTIQKVFGESEIIFAFSEGDSGVLMYTRNDCGMFALLMPVMDDYLAANRYFFLT